MKKPMYLFICKLFAAVWTSVAISVLVLFCTDTDIGKNAISVADISAEPIIGTPLPIKSEKWM